MVIKGSPGAALSQQGLEAGHEVDDKGFKLEREQGDSDAHARAESPVTNVNRRSI